jgi:hypothetical protein
MVPEKEKEWHLDLAAGTNGHLNAAGRRLENFQYWGDRISILKQAFDDSKPKTVSQWWHDDRKRVQRYTFWIAALVLLLTIVFGFVQSLAGVVVEATPQDHPDRAGYLNNLGFFLGRQYTQTGNSKDLEEASK